MATPHINAKKGDFAKTVLMPGDPLRAKYIAENYLDDVRQVNDVRNMFGYTGTYKGTPVSVMGSGMGIPSISIYSKELYTQYDVENIIRIGSAGSVQEDIKLRDIVIGMGASTDSQVNRQRFKHLDFAAIASYQLLEKTVEAARELELDVNVGNIFSADLFYGPDPEIFDTMKRHQIMAVEMEAAGLYGVAAECGKNALALMTISDHIITGEQTTAEERQNTFNDMMILTLEAVRKL